MNFQLTVPLNTTAEQAVRLQALQTAFAEVCNALSPVVRDKRCWNRVTLHHLTYHPLRERFPHMGSQMICNAIYSVCRTSRQVYQHPASPFNITRRPDAPLPLIRFAPSAPVYFDRHTLSLKNDRLSMYTLDGRMRFDLALKAEDQERFHRQKLREIVLTGVAQSYRLTFSFETTEATDEDVEGEVDVADATDATDTANITNAAAASELPEYLLVLPEPPPELSADALLQVPHSMNSQPSHVQAMHP
jgi:hypothetical protein